MIQIRNISVMVVVFILLSCLALAQDSNQVRTESKTDACKRFTIQVVNPPQNFDQRMPVLKPVEGVDYKLKVINPCPGASPQIAARRGSTTPFKPGIEHGKSELPPLKFTLPNVDNLQTPVDVIRKFALPKLPQN